MAWLQNFAGKAENLLNKIDQNAAIVLNESNLNIKFQGLSDSVPNLLNASGLQTNENTNGKYETDMPHLKKNASHNDASEQPFVNYINENEAKVLIDEGNMFSNSNGTEGDNKLQTDIVAKSDVLDLEIPIETERSLSHLPTHFVDNSIVLDDELNKYEEKVCVLQQQNEELSKQLLNLQHLYYEVKNQNDNLQAQVQNANESAAAARSEMEQYRSRAQRILQEKEKMISFKEHVQIENSDVLAMCNEELKKQLTLQQIKNEELIGKLNSASAEVLDLQQQFHNMEKSNKERIRVLQEALSNERQLRNAVEEELQLKIQEINFISHELLQQKSLVELKNTEIENSKKQLQHNVNMKGDDYLESQLQSLTQMLISKQNTLEAVTTERNALRLQLEKLGNEYHNFMLRVQQTQVKIPNVNDTDDVKSQVPDFMRISALDAGMTRKVKKAYGTLDTISVRTGVFLRRYPLARVFVFCYGVLLHFWVFIVLFSYVPSGR